jgi:hypothetical protein
MSDQPTLQERLRPVVLITDADLDALVELTVVRWEGHLRCAYLNNFRIAGGKPWGGGSH